MHAVRTIRFCDKECLCLYVCPTGATDTESGQIDFTKCIGCGMCFKSCPSHAISLVPEKYPVQQPKTAEVCDSIMDIAKGKVEAEAVCKALKESASDPVKRQFAEALEISFRRQAEDLYREVGYMLPQSANARKMLKDMLENKDPAFPKAAVSKLIEMLQIQER